ncbi:MAG: aminotransferase class IV family protein [Bacteroidales bacterium]|nr:aminotransferase class IV family protein [Bacteroidales bacterium]
MSDCIGSHFILDGNILPVADFNEHLFARKEAIYEVLRVEESVPLFIEDHLNRLVSTHQLSNLRVILDVDTMYGYICKLIKTNHHASGPVKIFLDNEHVLVYLMKPYLPKPIEYVTGVETTLMQEERFNPTAKIWNPELREKTVKLLNEKSVYEIILVNKDGFITEGSRSNVFLIRDNMLCSAPRNTVLPGITREKVIKICSSAGIQVREELIHRTNLKEFEVMFLTGTSRKIVPVRRVDDLEFKIKNKILQQISEEFEQLVNRYILSHKAGC